MTAPRHGTPPTAAPTWRWTQVEAPRMPRELASSLYARFAGHCFARAHLLTGDVGVAHPVLDELAPPTHNDVDRRSTLPVGRARRACAGEGRCRVASGGGHRFDNS